MGNKKMGKKKMGKKKYVKVPRMGIIKDGLKAGLKAGGEKLIEVGSALAKKKALELLGKGVAMVK